MAKKGDHVKKDRQRGRGAAPPGAPQFAPKAPQAPGNPGSVGPGRPQGSVPTPRRGQDGRGRGTGR